MMKKNYQKPQIIRVSLKVEQTVLGGCKFNGYQGAGSDVNANCGTVEGPIYTPCDVEGS
jgi:predicted small secreted protein